MPRVEFETCDIGPTRPISTSHATPIGMEDSARRIIFRNVSRADERKIRHLELVLRCHIIGSVVAFCFVVSVDFRKDGAAGGAAHPRAPQHNPAPRLTRARARPQCDLEQPRLADQFYAAAE